MTFEFFGGSADAGPLLWMTHLATGLVLFVAGPGMLSIALGSTAEPLLADPFGLETLGLVSFSVEPGMYSILCS